MGKLRAAMLCAAVVAATNGARADLVYQEDFSGSDGGYTVANTGAIEGPWVYDGAETWTVEGSENVGAPTHSRLTSPTFTITGSALTELSFVHRYSIEGGLWDGAAVFTSINGGPFEQVPGSSFTSNGYTGSGLIGNHDLNGGEGYNGDSPGYANGTYITSVAELGTLADGDTLALQFLGAWDEYSKGSSPNWQIDSVEVFTVADLRWDNAGSGNWDSAQWVGGPPSVPNDTSYVLLDAANTDTVTVAADAVAYDLAVEGGGIAINGGQSLAVSGAADFAAGTTLSLADGATFSASSGIIPAIAPAGDVTVGATLGELKGAGYDDSAPANTPRVFTKTGGGTFSLDNSDGNSVKGAQTTFVIEEGTLKSNGVHPLGAAAAITLAGGTLDFGDALGVPNPGPAGSIAHWAFDEADGSTVAADTSGSATVYDGAVMGGASFTSDGKIGGAMQFDGDDDYVELPAGFDDFTGGISVALWAKPTATNAWSRFVDFSNGPSSDNILFANTASTNGLTWEIYGSEPGNQRHDVSGAITLGEWQHFAATVDASGNAVIYKDGQPILTNTQRLPTAITRTINYIGESPWGGDDFYEGMMDELYVYDRALTPAEVTAMAGLRTPPDMSGIDLTVTAPSGLRSSTTSATAFGSLTLMDGGSLVTSGMGPISFTATTIDAAAGWVGLGAEVETDFGGIDANSANVVITKMGSGTWAPATPPANAENASYGVQEGVLSLAGSAAWGPINSVVLSGGTLEVLGEQDAQAAAPAGAIAYWSFDDPAGSTTLADTSGNSIVYDGTIMGGASFVEGRVGGALEFDGNNDYVDLPDGFDDFTGGISVALWAKPMAMNVWSRFIDFSNGPGDNNILFTNIVSTNNLRWEVRTGQGGGAPVLDLTNTLDVGEWQHLVATMDPSGNTVIYKDGQEIGSATMWMPTVVTRTVNYIGESPWGGDAFYEGFMDEMYVYDRALSAEEVLGLYTGGSVPDMSGVELTVTEDSTLKVVTGDLLDVGALTLENGVLTTSGAIGGMTFAATNVAPGATAVGFDAQVVTNPGPITTDGVTPVTISKSGPADVILDQGGGDLTAATLDVQGGRLVALHDPNPLGAATLQLSGGEVLLSAKATAVSPIAYDNPVVVTSNSVLTAGAGGIGAAGPMVVNLGAGGVTLDAGTLELRTTDDYSLNVVGAVGGAGGISMDQGNVTLADGGSVASFNVTGGSLSLGADLNVAAMSTIGGTVDTGANQLIISESLRIENVEFSMEAGTLAARSSDLLAGGDFTLAGGTLTIAVPGAPSGAIAYWAFDEEPGSTVLPDTSGSATVYDGDVIDGATFVTDGKIGGAMEFDGVDGYVDLPDGFDDFSGGITVALWAKPTALNYWSRFIDFSTGQGSNNILFANRSTSSDLTWEIYGTNPGTQRHDVADAITLDEWQHFVATIDESGNAAIYKDGVEIFSGTQRLPNNVNRTINYLGESAWGGDEFYAGFMDEMYIYDRGLSAEEVAKLYGDGEGPAPTPLDLPDTNLAVTADATLFLDTYQDATFGNLTVGGGVSLEIAGAAAEFNDLTFGADASIEADALLLRGTLSSAGNPGTLTIDGELEFDDTAVYLCDPSADTVVASADVFLGGTLALQAASPMGDLTAGEWGEKSSTILSASSDEGVVVGTFENLPAAGEHVGSGVFFREVTYTPEDEPTDVELSVFQAAPGDVNGDKKVDNADLQGILGAGSFGTGDGWGWTEGDFNGNGTVGNDDLQLILATGLFGTGVYAAGAAAASAGSLVAVPEPGTLVMLVAGLLGLLLGRRRFAGRSH